MKKLPNNKIRRRKGAVLVETLIGAVLFQIAFLFLYQLSAQVWSRIYVQTETFFLARTRLYQNTNRCGPSAHISQDFIRRQLSCTKGVANTYELNLFDSFLKTPPTQIRVKLGVF